MRCRSQDSLEQPGPADAARPGPGVHGHAIGDRGFGDLLLLRASWSSLPNLERLTPAVWPAREHRRTPQPCSASSATSGAVDTVSSWAAAGPVGLRRCCFWFTSVFTPTRMSLAKSRCDKAVCSLTALASGAVISSRLDGLACSLAVRNGDVAAAVPGPGAVALALLALAAGAGVCRRPREDTR